MISIKKILIAFIFSLITIAAVSAQTLYWENPEVITETDTRFPTAVSNPVRGKASAFFWEEVDKDRNRLYISAKTSVDGINWRDDRGLKRFIGPINYSGEVPDIYTSAVSKKGVIAVAALTNTKEITVSISEDGRGFKKKVLNNFEQPLVAPRIYATSNGGFILFASMGMNDSFKLYYTVSPNGSTWEDFKEFGPAQNLTNPFAPASVATANGDVVILQAQYSSAKRFSYQLYTIVSNDNFVTWSEPVLITDQTSLQENISFAYTDYNNQRPYLLNLKNKIYLSWERTRYNSDNSSIWFAELNNDGNIQGYTEQISTPAYASKPVLFGYDDCINLLWFDSRSGSERIYHAQKKGILWSESSISMANKNSSYAYPVISNNGKEISFIWQQKETKNNGETRIVFLSQDHSVLPPVLTPEKFTDGKRIANSIPVVNIAMSEDSSGVAGYSWIISKNKDAEPKEELMCKPSEVEISNKLYSDGVWYLKAKQLDFAGNWSESTTVSFELDTTPPEKPVLAELPKDEKGMSLSNTFTVQWNVENPSEDFAGYKYSYRYISSLPDELIHSKHHRVKLETEEVQQLLENIYENKKDLIEQEFKPASNKISENTELYYRNQRNGIYMFTVAAVDDLGNTSEPVSMLIPANKFIPFTYLTSIKSEMDEMDTIYLTIYGGGFKYDGLVSEVYIDQDGKAPYDRVFKLDDNDYKINSDNMISGINFFDIEPGDYRIGLLHQDRGLYFSGENTTVKVTQNGTVKLQNTYKYLPQWEPITTSRKYHINVGIVLLVIVFIMALVGLIAAIRGLSSTAHEAVAVRHEVTALITGDIMPQEKKKKSEALKRKGLSLKVRLAGFSVALVVTIIILVSLPLGIIMTRIQDKTLSSGLHDRVIVLLDSLATGTKAYLPTQDILQLSYLPDQKEALPEARYATITGMPADGSDTSLDYVWASNDADVTNELTNSGNKFGLFKINNPKVKEILKKVEKLNEEAYAQIGTISQTISELNIEGSSLALNSDEESIRRLEEIEVITTELNTRLNTILANLSSEGTGSYPEYNSEFVDKENTNYLFYKPVLYRQGNDNNYVRGLILVEVSTASLVEASYKAMITIIYTAFVIALIAIIIGIIGSLILATVIIKPISTLSSHVAMIRDTEDKETLEGKELILRRTDEIGVLGDTVNDMTRGLVEAARISKNLVVGKDIQTKFIPLQVDKNGRTLTTGFLNAKGADFFSYYAGANELSGDYFDYKKLDETHYAVIKCDVSGHGVPAALIMVQVATLFLDNFRDWNVQNPYQGMNIAPVVSKINDLLESRGFKDRFAAFTLCILDTESGDAWFCNAGDNMLHIYDSETRKKKIITLQQTPAAGMFNTEFIDMKGGYKVSKITLKKNDVLFLYTDGIEESRRKFRNEDYQIIECNEAVEPGQMHGNHQVGENSEELSPERVNAIIESVFARSVYNLNKYHNPAGDEKLTFDFTNCAGTEEEAVMALVSIEKIFRMYRPKERNGTEKVRVDRKIDSFLRQHFVQYGNYCGSKDDPDKENPYLFYNGVCEDPQYDDLTCVAIKKN